MSGYSYHDRCLLRARAALLRWEREGLSHFHGNETTSAELRWLFDVDSVNDIELRHLEALGGVHGYSYYKMLVARKAG